MNVKPLYDQLIIDTLVETNTTESGIILPESNNEKPYMGVVVSAGKGKMLENGTVIPLEVQVGDTVMFGKYAGTDVKFGGKAYLMMKESEILCVIQEEGD